MGERFKTSYFIDKNLICYEDCITLMKNIKKELEKRENKSPRIMIRIQCGTSKCLQKWGDSFWQLIDNPIQSPELFIDDEFFIDASVYRQQIYNSKGNDNIENFVEFYHNKEVYNRFLTIIEKEALYE